MKSSVSEPGLSHDWSQPGRLKVATTNQSQEHLSTHMIQESLHRKPVPISLMISGMGNMYISTVCKSQRRAEKNMGGYTL